MSSLSTVSMGKFYAALLGWQTGISFTPGNYYTISKSITPVATVAVPDPTPVTVTLLFSVASAITIPISALEASIASNGYADYGVTYDRIAKALTQTPYNASAVFYDATTDVAGATWLDATQPVNLFSASQWAFMTAIDPISIFNFKTQWLAIGTSQNWPTLSSTAITDITTTLQAMNASIAAAQTTTGVAAMLDTANSQITLKVQNNN